MRNRTLWGVLLIGLAGVGSVAWGQCSPNCGNSSLPERRTISVPGIAQVAADADLAIVRVGYKIYGPDAKTAYDQATEISNAVINALTGTGIPKTEVESTSQVLQRTQAFELQQFPAKGEDRERRQFTVSQSWMIRVKPDQAGIALNTAVTAGANDSGWIQWVVQDPSTIQAKASAEAVGNAQKAAEQIAAKAGVRLGRLVSVSENQGSSAFVGGFGYAAGMGGNLVGMGDTMLVSGGMLGPNQQLVINSRRVQFHATVLATFAIADDEKTDK